jgi:Tfp pilus assembly protein FimV
MKKTTYTTIRYNGKKLAPGEYDFDKKFVEAHPDIFKPEVSKNVKVPEFASALQSQVEDLEGTVETLSSELSAKDKEIAELKAKVAASGGGK